MRYQPYDFRMLISTPLSAPLKFKMPHRSRAREIDVAALNVGAGELNAQFVPYIQAL